MTLYSCLPLQNKMTVLATWAGEDADSHSAKVTTVADTHQAARLAHDLTRLSEAMWDAAAWLDVYDPAEAAVTKLIAATRADVQVPAGDGALFEGCRHAKSWSTMDLVILLGSQMADTVNGLSRAQRLSVADELEADASARVESLELLPTGCDPTESTSRIWQAADITRATKLGLCGHLPDGAAGWLSRTYDAEHGPAERWGAREMLHRLEQLDAAARTVNGRGGAEIEDLFGPQAHLVLPSELFGVSYTREDGQVTVSDQVDPVVAGSTLAKLYRDSVATVERMHGDAIFYVQPDVDMRHVAPWERDVFAKAVITLSVPGESVEVARLDAADTAGFAAALGSWVTHATYRAPRSADAVVSAS